MEKVAVYFVQKIDKNSCCKINIKEIDNWCKKNNYDYFLYLDFVANGQNINERRAFTQLKEDLADGKFSKVIIKNIPNVSKDRNFIVDFVNYAEFSDCQIISMDKFNPHKYKDFIESITKKMKEELER